jgi:hypothetical protein
MTLELQILLNTFEVAKKFVASHIRKFHADFYENRSFNPHEKWLKMKRSCLKN